MSWILFFWACSSPDEPLETTAWDLTPNLGDAVDLAAVEAGMRDVYANLRATQSTRVFEGFSAAQEHWAAGCPEIVTWDDGWYWHGDCVTPDGTDTDGYGYVYSYEDHDWRGDGGSYDVLWSEGTGTTLFTDGTRFHMGGRALLYEGENPNGSCQVWGSQLGGSFSWDDPSVAEHWIHDGGAPTLNLEMWLCPSGGGTDGKNLQAEGGFVTPGGIATNLEGWVLSNQGSCTHTRGTVELRLHDGTWVQVVLDSDSCDGCGEVTHFEETLGQVCVDLGGILDFEGAPW